MAWLTDTLEKLPTWTDSPLDEFRFPDLEGNPDGTLDQRKDHSGSGFRMRELLLGEFVEEGGDGTVMDWPCGES